MPSPTEDRELEELLSYLETDERKASTVSAHDINQNHEAVTHHRTPDNMSDDEDYDQLFLEVIGDGGCLLQEGSEEMGAPQEPQSQDSRMDTS